VGLRAAPPGGGRWPPEDPRGRAWATGVCRSPRLTPSPPDLWWLHNSPFLLFLQRRAYFYDYGNHYAWFLSIFAITMAYSVSCPLITPCGLVYAVMKHVVDRYNIFFAYRPSALRKSLHETATSFLLIGVVFTQCNTLFFQVSIFGGSK
jgi:hypothetical protein